MRDIREAARVVIEPRTEGISLLVEYTDAPGVELTPLNIDAGWPERQYMIVLDDVKLDVDRLLATAMVLGTVDGDRAHQQRNVAQLHR